MLNKGKKGFGDETSIKGGRLVTPQNLNVNICRMFLYDTS